jgi:nucleoid DNA-binding protein
MLKSELIEKIAAQNPHLYRQDAEKIVNPGHAHGGAGAGRPS